MSLCANVSFPSIDNGILNNLGPIHHPNVDGIEPVLLREMACDFLCIGLFPEPALILSFNLHQNEPLVTNFKSVQWLWKKNIQEKSFEKGSLQIGHIIQASRCWEICTQVSLLLNWVCSQLMFFCWYVYYGILFSLRFQIRASWPYVLIIYFTISWTHCIMLNCSVEIWVCVTELLFCLLFVYYCPACRTSLIATRFWVVMICPIIKCLTVLEFSFILFDLCLFITIFNFILNYVPTVTFWIFTYHKIWILLIIFYEIIELFIF